MAKTSLPPGFRFHPTDVELTVYYLKRKLLGKHLRCNAVSELDLYKFAPWDLPGKFTLPWKMFSKLYHFTPFQVKTFFDPLVSVALVFCWESCLSSKQWLPFDFLRMHCCLLSSVLGNHMFSFECKNIVLCRSLAFELLLWFILSCLTWCREIFVAE